MSARSDVLDENPYLHKLLELIRPSIIEISILQVDQTNGDGSEAHVQQLAAAWMTDNADLVTGWIATAETEPTAEPAVEAAEPVVGETLVWALPALGTDFDPVTYEGSGPTMHVAYELGSTLVGYDISGIPGVVPGCDAPERGPANVGRCACH